MRRAAAALAALLLAALCGCGGDPTLFVPSMPVQDEGQEQQTAGISADNGSDGLTLVWFSGETLDPTASPGRTNLKISTLIYDTLVSLDERLAPTPALAERWEWNGAELTLYLRDGVIFHDGSELTADDAVRSIRRMAENEDNPYCAALGCVESVRAEGKNALVVTFDRADIALAANLAVPVVRLSGSDAVGTGRYEPVNDGRGGLALAAFEGWWGGEVGIKRIELISVPDSEAVEYAFMTGQSDLLDIEPQRTPDVIRRDGVREYQYASTDLVYLDVNTNRDYLDAPARRYISRLLERERLAYQNARTTDIPLRPDWWALSGAGTRDGRREKEPEQEDVFDARRRLKLIVNSENDLREELADKIASQLALADIGCDVVRLDWESYGAALEQGDYDLALCEAFIGADMDIRCFIEPDGALNFSGYSDAELSGAVSALTQAGNTAAYRAGAAALCDALRREEPLIALFFRSGTVAAGPALSGDIRPVQGSVFAGLEKAG